MKKRLIKLFALAGVLSASAMLHAADKVNSKQSLRVCKSALESDLNEGSQYKFKRDAATSVEAQRYKHWFNVVEKSDEGKMALKVLCETSRTGDVLVLEIKPGRWKI